MSFIAVLALLAALLPSAFAATAEQSAAADELYTLGVLRGTANGFGLDDEATRQEALTMVIRMLGRENAALNGTYKHPFGDVAAWADGYVGYAYQKGLARGVSATAFGGENTVTVSQYLVFVLRALGYSDARGDFVWNAPWTLAEKLGLVKAADAGLKTAACTRGEMALITDNALAARFKGSDLTARENLRTILSAKHTALSSTEVARKCAGAVFSVYTYYDEDCEAQAGIGSGFFVGADGTAVTNYHVLQTCHAARAILLSGESYPIEGIISANATRDVAIVKISKTAVDGTAVSAFPTVELGHSASVEEGDTVYAFGSPIGQGNTMSAGIVSNAYRTVDGSLPFIQTDAATAKGSSGGALVNDLGQVVAITSAKYNEADNMNLCVPIDAIISMAREGPAIPLSYYAAIYDGGRDTKCSLKAGVSSVTVRQGQVQGVLVTTDCTSAVMLEASVSDENVVYAGFGAKADEGSFMLYIAGLQPGTAAVTVQFLDGYGNPDAKVVISVTVTQKGAS